MISPLFSRAELGLCLQSSNGIILDTHFLSIMKVNVFLVFVFFTCCCQAHVAARWPHQLNAVKKQSGKSQQGGASRGGSSGNPGTENQCIIFLIPLFFLLARII